MESPVQSLLLCLHFLNPHPDPWKSGERSLHLSPQGQFWESQQLASLLRVSIPISKDRKFAPGEDLPWQFTSHFISVLWGRGEKGKGKRGINQVTRAAQRLPIPAKVIRSRLMLGPRAGEKLEESKPGFLLNYLTPTPQPNHH